MAVKRPSDGSELGASAFTVTRAGAIAGLASSIDVDGAITVITRDDEGLVSSVAGATTWGVTRDADGLISSGAVA